MGGDIKLKQSKKGLTVMAFKLPVKTSIKADKDTSSEIMGMSSKNRVSRLNKRNFVL